MDDQSAREPREDWPDPDAGAAPGGSGSGLAAGEKAQNAVTVLDPDREPEDTAAEIAGQIDRLPRAGLGDCNCGHPVADHEWTSDGSPICSESC